MDSEYAPDHTAPRHLKTRHILGQRRHLALCTHSPLSVATYLRIRRGVGFEVADAFIKASAASIILVGRNVDTLESAAQRLGDVAKNAGKKTKIITKPCDITDIAAVDAFWEQLATEGITADVWVHSAARISQPEPMMKLGAAEVWAQLEANVKGPLYFAEKFTAQPGDQQRVSTNHR